MKKSILFWLGMTLILIGALVQQKTISDLQSQIVERQAQETKSENLLFSLICLDHPHGYIEINPATTTNEVTDVMLICDSQAMNSKPSIYHLDPNSF